MPSPSSMAAASAKKMVISGGGGYTAEETAVLGLNPWGWWRISDLQSDKRTIPPTIAGSGNLVSTIDMNTATHAQFGSQPVYNNTSSAWALVSDLSYGSWTFMHDGSGCVMFITSAYVNVAPGGSNLTQTVISNTYGPRPGVAHWLNAVGKYAACYNNTGTVFETNTSGVWAINQRKCAYFRYAGTGANVATWTGRTTTVTSNAGQTPSTSAPLGPFTIGNNSDPTKAQHVRAFKCAFAEAIVFKYAGPHTDLSPTYDAYLQSRYGAGSFF